MCFIKNFNVCCSFFILQQVNYNLSKQTELPLSYSVKIIPKKKAEYSVMKLHCKFQSIDSLKKAILDVCKEKVSSLDLLNQAMVQKANSGG